MTRAEEKALEAYPKYWAKAVLYDGQTIEIEANERTREVFIQAYEQAEKDLGWHSVDESLPPIDEEVIVLTNEMHGHILSTACHLCYGHIVDTKYCVDYNGWNIPGVKYWMPMPKLEEEK